MAYKLIYATEAKPGVIILMNQIPCMVKSNNLSKTGKHGHVKCRIEALGLKDNKKRVFLKGGHEKLESPRIDKNKGQILSIQERTISLMDLKDFETIEIDLPEELKGKIHEEEQIEYWTIEGKNILRKKI